MEFLRSCSYMPEMWRLKVFLDQPAIRFRIHAGFQTFTQSVLRKLLENTELKTNLGESLANNLNAKYLLHQLFNSLIPPIRIGSCGFCG